MTNVKIILVGLSHHTASLEQREQLTGDRSYYYEALQSIQSSPDLSFQFQEAVILSTCNRFEIYLALDSPLDEPKEALALMANLLNVPFENLMNHLYVKEGEGVIHHLMRVACGLESMVLGESQILGQVGRAFAEAQSYGLTGAYLSKLFSQARYTGKRAHTETEISRLTTSISHIAVLLMRDKLKSRQSKILIVGAGEIAIWVIKALQKQGYQNIALINRTYQRAQSLSEDYEISVFRWEQVDEALLWADAIFTATSATQPIITEEMLAHIIPQRSQLSLMLIDIAVPRNVEVGLETLAGVERYDIDDLRGIADANAEQRSRLIPDVEYIIKQELQSFVAWYQSRIVVPVIKDLRQWAVDIAQIEVEQALHKLGDVDEHTEHVINHLSYRLVNKLLHEPTVQLRTQAAEGNGLDYAHAVTALFGLSVATGDDPNGN